MPECSCTSKRCLRLPSAIVTGEGGVASQRNRAPVALGKACRGGAAVQRHVVDQVGCGRAIGWDVPAPSSMAKLSLWYSAHQGGVFPHCHDLVYLGCSIL
jgi:hypothetical protein